MLREYTFRIELAMLLNNIHPCICEKRSGIALVIVLGFLSILIIMAVGFSISMRVERLVARTNIENMRAIQFGEVALVRVLDDIDNSVDGSMIPDRNGDWVDGVMESLSPDAGATMAGDLLKGHVTNYVPRSMWSATVSASANAEWVPIKYRDKITKSEKKIGQYAYLILDSSGLIDVNADYNRTASEVIDRSLGGSIYELQLSSTLLPEVTSYWRNMVEGRTKTVKGAKPWYRLETAAEIMPMLSRGYGTPIPAEQPLDLDEANYNFITYSRFPAGYLSGGNVLQPILISSNTADYQSQLASTFGTLGVPDAETFVKNLIDYVDADNVPQNLNSYCTEAVPLINEIVVSNSYQDLAGQHVIEYRMLVELWYPFTTTNTGSYTLRMRARYTGADPGPNPGMIPTTAITLTPPGGTWTMGDFLVVTSTPVTLPTMTVQDLSGVVIDQIRATVYENGVPVDQVGNPNMLQIKIGELITGFGNFGRGVSANDPRINWDCQDAAQWRDTVAIHSLGRINDMLTFAAADGHTLMYVANRPLKSVGELGLLLYDVTKPWLTPSLLSGPNYLSVLDQFTLVTNSYRQGLINPNSYNTNVLATVFNDMPVERVPFDPATRTLNSAELTALSRELADKSISFTNLSDLQHMGPRITAAASTLSSATHESIVRNSAGLFSPRQQLFTVILAAQSLDENGFPTAEKRGVGLVWRDPYPSTNSMHQTLVRNFRWLTE